MPVLKVKHHFTIITRNAACWCWGIDDRRRWVTSLDWIFESAIACDWRLGSRPAAKLIAPGGQWSLCFGNYSFGYVLK